MSEVVRGMPTLMEEGVDEDFLYHLYRGGELLAAGKNLEARDELERAYHLKPQNPKAQNLLGLVYFKLGLLERAIEVYDRLVDDNPGDATLRVNLGLVYLKAGQISEAIRQLETAVDAIPDHPKALNYLGLAYAQAQSHQKAREMFERAGNGAMVRKMEEALRGEGSPPDTAKALEHAEPRASASEPLATDRREARESESLRSPTRALPLLGLSALAKHVAYEPPASAPFAVDSPIASLKVSGELRTRLSGLLWVRGDIQRQGEMKRFRGRATDKPFGEGGDRMFHLSGEGQVVVALPGTSLTIIELEDEAGYLVEDALFAFDEALGYENGRVPSKVPPDLQLVHLRGRGKALLRSVGDIRSVEVRAGQPLQLPLERLVGWVGTLTPTLLLPEGGEPSENQVAGRWLKLEGDGWALWALPNQR